MDLCFQNRLSQFSDTSLSGLQVVVGSFLSDAHKTQSKSDSPLGLAHGGTSGGSSVTTPGSYRPPALKNELKGSTGIFYIAG